MSAVQRSAEWFAERAALSVTGSMVGAVLGHNPYCSPEQALRNKVREVLGLPPDRPTNAFMQRGIDLEPEARAAYEAETGNLVTEVGVMVNPTIPWIGSSPDGVIK